MCPTCLRRSVCACGWNDLLSRHRNRNRNRSANKAINIDYSMSAARDEEHFLAYQSHNSVSSVRIVIRRKLITEIATYVGFDMCVRSGGEQRAARSKRERERGLDRAATVSPAWLAPRLFGAEQMQPCEVIAATWETGKAITSSMFRLA